MMSGSVVNASYAHAAWPSPSSGHHAETRHPGTADAAQRQARVGLRERNGPEPTRAPRPATSQHRVGRGAGEAAAHLACESVLEGFRQRKLRCRYFATRGWGLLSSLAAEVRAETPLKLAAQVLRQEAAKGDRRTTRVPGYRCLQHRLKTDIAKLHSYFHFDSRHLSFLFSF